MTSNLQTSARADEENTPGGTVTEPVEETRLSAGEVRERAVGGAVVDVLRGIGVRFFGLLGTLVLARLLTPHDFGIVAFGATFVTFANFLADGGVGAGLIRRLEPPTHAELTALLGFQLVISTALAVGIGVFLIPLGEIGQVAALMTLALPLMSFRTPGVILFERRLNYKPLLLVDVVESIFYYGWAVALVVHGWGVWGLASANIVRALAGSILLLAVLPSARLVPSLSWSKIRPILGFGFQYQAVGVANLVRDQGTNAVIALLAGVTALGVWSVAFRILQIPLLFLASLWRISFPGMARLVEEGDDVGKTLERVIAVVAVASGLILAPLVAATPAWLPALLGGQWTDAVAVIPPASLHLMVFGPITVALIGYLWAMGEGSAVLRSTLVGIPMMAVVMIPLLTIIGVPAVGFGWLASGLGETTVLILAARKHAEFRITPGLLPPAISAVVSASLGWIVSTQVDASLLGGLVGALLAVTTYVLALWIWHRSYLLDSVRLSIRGVRQVLTSPALK